MPLASTGVPEFLQAHPTWDGRGVLIGILDGGIDVGVAGFETTATGLPKVVDLRDFSAEGHIALSVLEPAGDSVRVGDRSVGGFGRIRALDANGPWFGGVLRERSLGQPPAADVNGNGRADDRLPLIVVRASDAWVLFADTDGDGSFADERGIRDYLIGRETLGWRPGSAPAPLAVAANFSGSADAPRLDLVFDTGGHGTHVAGIAAARHIGKVRGFDGVAPGAQLLGLKIARNDLGGVTTTGSVLRAIDYAVRFARARLLPLVLNMSFGVGNEREGAAVLDAMIDSVLAANPDLLFVTSAGNDGPGLSTVGFPGSVRHGLSVGATHPGVFMPTDPRGRATPDVLAFFSSRGGEVAKPDLVAPGYAFSTVPRWDLGDEFKGGTSMAAPHVAGLAAVLRSAAMQEHREVTAADLRRALIAGSRPVGDAGLLDQGAGQPTLGLAWRALRAPVPRHTYGVEIVGAPGQSGVMRFRRDASGDSLIRLRVRRLPAEAGPPLRLTSSAPWLRVPPTVDLREGSAEVAIVERLAPSGGVHLAIVEGREEGSAEPRFRVPVTVVVPVRPADSAVKVTGRIAAGGVQRLFFEVDSGRPFRVSVETASPADSVLSFLHASGGNPVPGAEGVPAGANQAAGVIAVDGRDAHGIRYEAVAAVPPTGPMTTRIIVQQAPVVPRRIGRRADTLESVFTSESSKPTEALVATDLIGAMREQDVRGHGGDEVKVPFELPAWAHRVTLDFAMPQDHWPVFTDFGFALRTADGEILGKQPLNYAAGRLTVELAPRRSAEQVHVVLAPGFAREGSAEAWGGRLTIRIYGADPVRLAPAGSPDLKLAPRARATVRFHQQAVPWPLPAGFAPLARLIAEVDGTNWTLETPIQP